MNEIQGRMMRAVWWTLGIVGLTWGFIMFIWWWF